MSPRDFWSWFKSLESELLQMLVDEPTRLVETVSSQIERVPPELTVEILLDTESNTAELAISANGDPRKIGHVLSFVRAAPPMEHWTVVPFRQRGESESVLFQGVELTVDDLLFKGTVNKQRLSVTFYIRGLEHGVDDPLAGAALLLMDEAIGEYDAMTLVRGLDAKPLNETTPADVFPFIEFRSYIDRIRDKIEPLRIKFNNVDGE